jgi:hypothetical protein
MAGNADNIILGPATILLNGTDIGFTKSGVSVMLEREYIDVQADQALGTVRKGKKFEKLIIKTTMLEINLERLRIAWDQPSSNYSGSSYFYLGYDISCAVNTHQITIIGSGPNCGTRTFYLYKAISIAGSEYKMSREEEVGLPVEFECLKDSTHNNKFGWILDT